MELFCLENSLINTVRRLMVAEFGGQSLRKGEKMKRFAIPFIILVILVAAFGFAPQKLVEAYSYPTFSIVSVETDVKVTIQTYNLPKDTDFRVLMGKYGTLGIGGTLVATTASGVGGVQTLTYDIPAALKGLDRIAIRMEATSGIGYYAYNWFWNNTAPVSPTATPVGPTPPPGYSGYPTFSISDVVADSKVTIKTYNLPKNTDFRVLMGKYGTLAIGGTEVATTNSGSGGTQSFTYDIPAGLKGLDRIAIRMEAKTGVAYFAYNWFWNNTSAVPVPTTVVSPTPVVTPIPGYSGIPTFSILAVVRDSKVTIKTYNLPKDTDFKVSMGLYGTLALGGTVVATTGSGDGGSKEFTYDIPDGLKGLDRIAIRMDSTSSPYYAYNWFWNYNAP